MTTWLSWSSGKDSAFALHALRREGVAVTGLFTTVNAAADRVAMHAVRRELLAAQAASAGLPLHEIELPWPCTNDNYEEIMAAFLGEAHIQGVTQMAFGDLFLNDIRAYREKNLQGSGIAPLFPLWGLPTAQLAHDMLAAGLSARLTSIDLDRIDIAFAGRLFDHALLVDLPEGIDPCGENGEFHTFVTAGPMLAQPIDVIVGEVVVREGFAYADLLAAPPVG